MKSPHPKIPEKNCLYGNIIPESENFVKGQKTFFAVPGAGDETDEAETVHAAAGGDDYAGGDVDRARIQLVFEGDQQGESERIL